MSFSSDTIQHIEKVEIISAEYSRVTRRDQCGIAKHDSHLIVEIVNMSKFNVDCIELVFKMNNKSTGESNVIERVDLDIKKVIKPREVLRYAVKLKNVCNFEFYWKDSDFYASGGDLYYTIDVNYRVLRS